MTRNPPGAYGIDAGVLAGLGWPPGEVRDLGWRCWYGGPWTGTSLLAVTKPAERAAQAPST